jgi:hypothetical protein
MSPILNFKNTVWDELYALEPEKSSQQISDFLSFFAALRFVW